MKEFKLMTSSEILQTEKVEEKELLEGLIKKPGLYIFAAPPKAGKSILLTKLSHAIATGSNFLDRKTSQGDVIYFDIDNYQNEARDRLRLLNLKPCEELKYVFDGHRSLKQILNIIESSVDVDKTKMIVIDCLGNLDEFITEDQYNFGKNYNLLTSFRDEIVKRNLVCILVHHSNKSTSLKGQDQIMGSRAITAATTGSIVLNIKNEFDDTAKLQFNTRSGKDIIKLKRDDKKISWVVMTEDDVEEYIDHNILAIIKYLTSSPRNRIEGTCQEIVAELGININPAAFTKFLKKNQDMLEKNNVYFSSKRTSKSRTIELELKLDHE